MRIALGATPSHLVGRVLRNGFLPVGVGILIGLTAAVGVARLLAGMLHGVSPFVTKNSAVTTSSSCSHRTIDDPAD